MEFYRAMRLVIPDPLVLLIAIVALIYVSRRRIHDHDNYHHANQNADNQDATHEDTDAADVSIGFIRISDTNFSYRDIFQYLDA